MFYIINRFPLAQITWQGREQARGLDVHIMARITCWLAQGRKRESEFRLRQGKIEKIIFTRREIEIENNIAWQGWQNWHQTQDIIISKREKDKGIILQAARD